MPKMIFLNFSGFFVCYDSGNSSFDTISHAAFVNDVGGKWKRKNRNAQKIIAHHF